MNRFRIFAALFAIGAGFPLVSLPANAQDLKTKAEAEGKLMMYATFTAADSKTLLDAFKQAYPKIDAAYYRSNDAALMERFVSENRGGQNLCDVIVTTSFYGNAIKKRGLFTPYDSRSASFSATAIKTRNRTGHRPIRIMARSATTRARWLRPACRNRSTICSSPSGRADHHRRTRLRVVWHNRQSDGRGKRLGIYARAGQAGGTTHRPQPHRSTGRRGRVQRRAQRLLANVRSIKAGRRAGGLGVFEIRSSPIFIPLVLPPRRRIPTQRACSSTSCFPSAARK
jgi:hypothetical protein